MGNVSTINQLLIFYLGDCILQGNIYLNIVIDCSQPIFLQLFIKDTSDIFFFFFFYHSGHSFVNIPAVKIKES